MKSMKKVIENIYFWMFVERICFLIYYLMLFIFLQLKDLAEIYLLTWLKFVWKNIIYIWKYFQLVKELVWVINKISGMSIYWCNVYLFIYLDHISANICQNCMISFTGKPCSHLSMGMLITWPWSVFTKIYLQHWGATSELHYFVWSFLTLNIAVTLLGMLFVKSANWL